jgi:hypothetical protein
MWATLPRSVGGRLRPQLLYQGRLCPIYSLGASARLVKGASAHQALPWAPLPKWLWATLPATTPMWATLPRSVGGRLRPPHSYCAWPRPPTAPTGSNRQGHNLPTIKRIGQTCPAPYKPGTPKRAGNRVGGSENGRLPWREDYRPPTTLEPNRLWLCTHASHNKLTLNIPN